MAIKMYIHTPISPPYFVLLHHHHRCLIDLLLLVLLGWSKLVVLLGIVIKVYIVAVV